MFQEIYAEWVLHTYQLDKIVTEVLYANLSLTRWNMKYLSQIRSENNAPAYLKHGIHLRIIICPF